MAGRERFFLFFLGFVILAWGVYCLYSSHSLNLNRKIEATIISSRARLVCIHTGDNSDPISISNVARSKWNSTSLPTNATDRRAMGEAVDEQQMNEFGRLSGAGEIGGTTATGGEMRPARRRPCDHGDHRAS